MALEVAWVFVVGGFVWLKAFFNKSVRFGEVFRDSFQRSFLIFLERQNMVSVGMVNLFSDFGVAAHGINADGTLPCLLIAFAESQGVPRGNLA